MNKKVIKIIAISLLITLVVVILTAIILYNTFNYKLYKNIVNSGDEKEIDVVYNFKFLGLWNKTIDYIKENNKDIIIKNNSYNIKLKYDNIPKFINFNISVKDKILEESDFNGLKALKINLDSYKDIESIKELQINIKEGLFENENVDIYYIDENGKMILYKKSITIENGTIKFELSNKEVPNTSNTFVIVYVPLKDINISNLDIEMKKSENKKIEYKIEPNNATNTKLKYEVTPNESLEMSSDGVITPKQSGKIEVKVFIEKEQVSKIVNVNILDVAEKINLNKNAISLEVGSSSNITANVIPDTAVNKELVWKSNNESVAKVGQDGKITAVAAGTCEIEVSTKQEPLITEKASVTIKNKVQYSAPVSNPSGSGNTGITYIQGILIANKKYSLPSSYNPGANPTALANFNTMKNEAKNEGIQLMIISGFRSYKTQEGLYNRYVSQYGQAAADTFSARPGHSEHQTGLAFDINSVEDWFANTNEGQWLAKNCHRFGFIIRYPKGKQSITGYKYEPWHIRYIGTDMATKVYNSGLCLEEYLGI